MIPADCSKSDDLEFVCESAISFKDSYKCLKKSKESCQQERRNLFLQEIKERHNNAVDKNRDLEVEDEESIYEEGMDVDKNVPKKTKRIYKNRLMYSEWLMEKPPDLEENWFVKLCPQGKRCLIVTKKYETVCYNRNGDSLEVFKSHLPGGSPLSQRNKFTMLECLYSYRFNCYFVLDVLYWGSLPLRKHDTDFRFYWLKAKFDELPEIASVSKNNHYSFRLIEHFPAVPNLIREMLETSVLIEENATCDGLLFYHKESPYVSGFTPLVCWLKPYMLPELLSVNVHPFYTNKKPKNYTTLKEYLEQKDSKRGHRKHENNVEMASEEDHVANMEF